MFEVEVCKHKSFIVSSTSPKTSAMCMQDWKSGTHCMGDVRAYQPNPPEVECDVDPSTYGFKFVQVEVNNRKKGWDRFTFSLPQKVRALHHNDVVYGADWRRLMSDFDERSLDGRLSH